MRARVFPYIVAALAVCVATVASTRAGDPPVRLIGCAPNPFNPVTTIAFTLDRSRPVDLTIHDPSGRLVRSLLGGRVLDGGVNEVRWDGRDNAGRRSASGVYLLRLRTGSRVETGRIVLLR